MGADLLVTWIELPKDYPPDYDGAKAIVKSLQKIPPPMDAAYTNLEELKEQLLADLDWLKEGEDGYRDMAVLDICHKRIMMSAGMSSGDSPTESYEVIDRVLHALGDDILFDRARESMKKAGRRRPRKV